MCIRDSLLITPNFLPSESVLNQIKNLQLGEALIYKNEVLAARLDMQDFSLSKIEKMTDITEEPVSYTHLDVYKRQFKGSVPCLSSFLSPRKITSFPKFPFAIN